MKKGCLFYIVFQVLKVLLLKSSFVSCCFTSPFTPACTIFLPLFSTSFNIIWKKNFRHKFFFLKGFTETTHPFNGQNLLNFLRIFPSNFVKHNCQILFLARIIRKKKIELLNSLNIWSKILLTIHKNQ